MTSAVVAAPVVLPAVGAATGIGALAVAGSSISSVIGLPALSAIGASLATAGVSTTGAALCAGTTLTAAVAVGTMHNMSKNIGARR